MPIDIKFITVQGEPFPLNNYVEKIFKEWSHFRDITKINDERAKLKQKMFHDGNHDLRNFELGDKVFMRKREMTSKLAPKFDSPFTIFIIFGETTYYIRDDKDPDRKFQGDGSELKSYVKRGNTFTPNKPVTALLSFLFVCEIQGVVGFDYGSSLVWREKNQRLPKGVLKVELALGFLNSCIIEIRNISVVYPPITNEQRNGFIGNCVFTGGKFKELYNETLRSADLCVRYLSGFLPGENCRFTNAKDNFTTETPCNDFLSPYDYILKIESYCKNYYNTTFREALVQACPASSNVRGKREEISMLVLGGLVGYITSKFITIPSFDGDIQRLNEQISTQIETNQEILHLLNATRGNFETIAGKLKNIEGRISTVENILPALVFSTPDLIYGLRESSARLEEMKFEMQKGKIPQKPFEKLGIKLNCSGACAIETVSETS